MSVIEIISGTNRTGSNTRRVADTVKGYYERLGQPVGMIDLINLPAEIFHPDSYTARPASFQPFVDRVLASAGLVVVVPEYNGGPPGVLKYFIDMLPFPQSFEGRPVAFVGLGAGEWGGLRPVEHMQQIFGYRNAHILPQRVFIREVHRLFDGKGNVVNEDVRRHMEGQSLAFVDFIQRHPVVMERPA